jgi:hypothetical protein
VVKTSPGAARAAIRGVIYQGEVPIEQLADFQKAHRVTQAILVEGRNLVRVYAPEGEPPTGFAPVLPSLEDAYLLLMRLGAQSADRERFVRRLADQERLDAAPAKAEVAR